MLAVANPVVVAPGADHVAAMATVAAIATVAVVVASAIALVAVVLIAVSAVLVAVMVHRLSHGGRTGEQGKRYRADE